MKCRVRGGSSVFALISFELRRPPRFALVLRAAAPRAARQGEAWWACLDSNQEPDRYERPALTIELQAPPRAAAFGGGQRCWRPLTMRLASRQCRVYFGISEIPLDAGVETEIYRFGPAPSRGAFRDRHGREAGCDGRRRRF